MTALKTKIETFSGHLKEEAELSNRYFKEKAKIDGDVIENTPSMST